MSEPAETRRLGWAGHRGAVVVAAYAVLGAILCWSRLAGLDSSYASDELRTIRHYVTEGPREILAGAYAPNNHELFSLLAWVTNSALGESRVAVRLWSALPFILGVAVATIWLHKRVGALAGILFLYFATTSPPLLDITRQARGYGIAFLAMAVLVVSALEAGHSHARWPIVALCAAGLVGTLTLPNFAIAFIATAAVLAVNPRLRLPIAIGLGCSIVVIAAWYAPNASELIRSSRQSYGEPISLPWILTAPMDYIVSPGLLWIDEALPHPGIGLLAAAVGLGLLVGSSPLLHDRHSAILLGAGVVATVVAFWATRTHVAPRFFSLLLVPMLMLLATGIASILGRFATTRRPVFRTVLGLTAITFAAVTSVPLMRDVTQLPREAVREVAATIARAAPPSSPVFAHIPYPDDLEFYLGRDVVWARRPGLAAEICRLPREAILVTQPWILEPVDVPCTSRSGTRHIRVEQYARGGHIDIWSIPPAPAE